MQPHEIITLIIPHNGKIRNRIFQSGYSFLTYHRAVGFLLLPNQLEELLGIQKVMSFFGRR